MTTSLSLRMYRHHTNFILLFDALLLFIGLPFTQSAISCSSDQYCHDVIRPESFCVDGFCSNPFQQGCLRTMLGESYKERICNSDDNNNNNNKNHCRRDSFWNYTEWRIHHSNWESSIFYAWLYQIIMMELLEVPITVGLTTGETLQSSFYNPKNDFVYSPSAYPWKAFEESFNVEDGDCTKTTESCAHVFPDVWNGQFPELMKAADNGYIDTPVANGQIGSLGWRVPAFTAKNDDTLVSFYGLRGEENRHKLAATFPRPMTYGAYCDTISKTNCSSTDPVAIRYPADATEHGSYYIKDAFEGHFVFTEKNNCTKNPATCTGHFVAPTCEYSINIDAQMYWNNFVGLESDGPLPPNGHYTYGQMVQIWRAANATKSNIITWFWEPEPTVEEFLHTNAEFQEVLLPAPTNSCVLARPGVDIRCSEDIWVRRHEALSACDQESHTLLRVTSSLIKNEYYNDEPAKRSPAYGLLRNLQITDLEMNDLIRKWINSDIDRHGYDARYVVCEYVTENLDQLVNEAIPFGYPRAVQEKGSSLFHSRPGKAALIFAMIMTILVLVAATAVIYYRESKVFVFAQVYFVLLIMLGSVCICLGAITAVLEPTMVTCTATEWLVLLGYTGQLVPLLVKIMALQKLFSNAKKMKRVHVTPQSMFRKVIIVMLIVIIYLILWTCIDPPRNQQNLVLIDNPKEEQDIVIVAESCGSFKFGDVWLYVAVGWETLCLVCASVLSFQSRNIRQEFNESASLATLVFTHVVFMILRLVADVLEYQDIISAASSAAARSFLLSLDTMLGMGVYLFPKFMVALYPPPDEKLDADFIQSMHESLQHSFSSFHNSTTTRFKRSSDGSSQRDLRAKMSRVMSARSIDSIQSFALSEADTPDPVIEISESECSDHNSTLENDGIGCMTTTTMMMMMPDNSKIANDDNYHPKSHITSMIQKHEISITSEGESSNFHVMEHEWDEHSMSSDESRMD